MRDLLTHQSGVVARRQLLASGLDAHDVRRLVRRRELVRVHDGVYVTHTGTLEWRQQAWAAVLRHWPAALSHTSALQSAGMAGLTQRAAPIEIAVDRSRRISPPPGIRIHRVSDLDARVHWQARPPRVRLEEALVDVAAASDEMQAVAVLADAVQARLTTPPRVRLAVAGRQRLRRRAFFDSVLDDIGGGVGSVLEHAYLTRVERPHGLPVGVRQAQARTAEGLVLRDVLYAEFCQVVELDGRVFHDGAARREADLRRDLAAAARGLATVRLGWSQVMGTPCLTAALMADVLAARGWHGCAHHCGDPVCGVAESPGDLQTPQKHGRAAQTRHRPN